MPDNDFRRSTSSGRPRTPGRATAQYRAASGGRGGRDGFGLIGFQAGICVLCVAAALIVRFTGGPIYASLRTTTLGAVSRSLTLSDVRDAYHNLQKAFPAATAVFGTGVSKTSSAVSNAAVGSKTTSAASKTSSTAVSGAASAPASSAGSRNGTASFVSEKPSKSSAVSVAQKLSGAGGADLNTYAASAAHAELLPPPDDATLAPVRLSVRPLLPVEGRLTSKYGWRIHPVTGNLSFHTGIDIAAAEGTGIRAALPGTVRDAGQNNAYGNYLLLDDGGGVTTFYGHCSAVLVKKGAAVHAGDAVARVGSTGISTGPHLHFEIRVNGVYTNPLWQFDLSSFSV